MRRKKYRKNVIDRVDDKFTEIWKDKYVRWRIFFIIINAVFSTLCALITQDLKKTIIYVIITAILDIIAVIVKYINIYEITFSIFNKNSNNYILFISALLPTIIGCVKNEVCSKQDFVNQLFSNLIPNILGTLIVCSMINHMLALCHEEKINSLISSNKYLCDVIFRIAFFASYINAINYSVGDKMVWINRFNSIYLFIIILFGAIIFSSFALLIINEKKLSNTIKNIHPIWTLIWGGAFLISCGITPIFCVEAKHEPILLLFNTFTAFVIVLGILFILANRTENKSDSYPFVRSFLFFVFMVLNCLYSFYKWNREGDIIGQIYSGLAVFLLAIFLIITLIIKQNNFQSNT